MKTYVLPIIGFLLCNIGCNENEISETNLPINENKIISTKESAKSMPACYVLCDFSASQGDNSRQMIMKNADTIFKSASAQGYSIKYYDICSAQFESPFFESTSFSHGIMKMSERKKEDVRIKEQADTLHNKMDRLYKAVRSLNTCIIRTLNKVVNSLARQAPGNYHVPIKVVILSDMLEDCLYDFGKIDIDHSHYDAAFKALLKMPKPNFTFANCNNIEITIVASSERTVNDDKLYKFWKQIFLKYDYDFKSPIVTDLPAWL